MLKSNSLNIHEKNGVTFLTFPLFDKYSVPHAFSTRLGGVSEGDTASMLVAVILMTLFMKSMVNATLSRYIQRICMRLW